MVFVAIAVYSNHASVASRDADIGPFPGKTVLIDTMPKLHDTMREPDIVEVWEEMKSRRSIFANYSEERASVEKARYATHRSKLRQYGPYDMALHMEQYNPDSKIWPQKIAEEAAGRRIVELLHMPVNGRPPFHVVLPIPWTDRNQNTLCGDTNKDWRRIGQLLNVEFHSSVTPSTSSWIVSPTLSQPRDFKAIERDPELFKRRLEKAHRVLKLWKYCLILADFHKAALTKLRDAYEYYTHREKGDVSDEMLEFWFWCVELDLDRGISPTTLAQAIALFNRDNCKLKGVWLKSISCECGKNAEEKQEEQIEEEGDAMRE